MTATCSKLCKTTQLANLGAASLFHEPKSFTLDHECRLATLCNKLVLAATLTAIVY